jgi:hypothetical protein
MTIGSGAAFAAMTVFGIRRPAEADLHSSPSRIVAINQRRAPTESNVHVRAETFCNLHEIGGKHLS